MTSEQTLQPVNAENLPRAAVATLIATIRRALNAVRAETNALRSGNHSDLRAFEHRKSQALLDLGRARATLPPMLHDDEISELLSELKSELSENMTLLDHHMQAVREITDLLAKSMLEADSDGTYGQGQSGFGHD
ncbi:hypothetical protein [Roseibium sp.]|uniref:hypothetical protein n=1 Tax=Roseibium sp. TaxID=1936156 RepID=UPI003A9805F9